MMATHGEKIDDLYRLVTQLVGRIGKIEGEVEWASGWIEKLQARDEARHVKQSTLERDLEEVRKSGDE